MVNLVQIEENRARAAAGMNRKNVIVDKKVLRKELLKVFYAREVNEMMDIICSCDMVEPKPKMKDLGNGIFVDEDFDLSKIN